MILPDNGKVVIIDDKIEDVIDLISALSSEKTSFVYYRDEKGEDLPETPIDCVRLIFLDLLLIDDNAPPVKKVISSIISRIKKIISPNNGPYILIYWSSQKKKYSKALERELNKRALIQYKPFEILSLTKPSSLDKIKEELLKRFERFKSLKAFLLLESLTNKSITQIVNHFTGIFINDENWDKNLKGVLYKTGQARIGADKEAKQKYEAFSKVEKLKHSLHTISSVIFDELEKNIRDIDEQTLEIDDIKDFDTSSLVKSKINSKLHIRKCSLPLKHESGNLYISRHKNKRLKNEIIKKNLHPSTNPKYPSTSLVALDITPVCDYSQDKDYIRVVHGILISEPDKKAFNGSLKFSKSSPILFINNVPSYLIFDFRFCDSIPRNVFDKLNSKPSYRINSELLLEIQSEFAKHINRPGIINL